MTQVVYREAGQGTRTPSLRRGGLSDVGGWCGVGWHLQRPGGPGDFHEYRRIPAGAGASLPDPARFGADAARTFFQRRDLALPLLLGGVLAGLMCLSQDDLTLSEEEAAAGKSASPWVVMTHRSIGLERLSSNGR